MWPLGSPGSPATPWGGQDREATVSEAESELEMVLARDIMHGAEKPRIQQIAVGDALVRQGEEGDQLCLVLDGVFEVEVDGRVVGRIGPGTVVGERALLEQGKRTATIRAVTECRAAFTGPHGFSEDLLTRLAELHHREALLDDVGTGGSP